jgi:anti-sigma regulatory factor (Ser/Thr protein kinase)
MASVSVHFDSRYPATGGSCPQVRKDVRGALNGLGLSGDGVYAASVMVSELFTNAIVHHPAQDSELVHVVIYCGTDVHGRWVGIAVTDTGCGTIRTPEDPAGVRADFGRGLAVVRGLGARLADLRVPTGYTVSAWFPTCDQLRVQVCQCDCATWHGMEPTVCTRIVEGFNGSADAPANDDLSDRLCFMCRQQRKDAAIVAAGCTTSPVLAGERQ